MRLHIVEHGCEPAFFHTDIAVEQHIEVAVHLSEGAVVAFGKAVVAVEQDGADLGKLFGKQVERVVGAAIISHDDFCLGRVLDDGRQEAAQHLGSVPIEYDNAQSHCDLRI